MHKNENQGYKTLGKDQIAVIELCILREGDRTEISWDQGMTAVHFVRIVR